MTKLNPLLRQLRGLLIVFALAYGGVLVFMLIMEPHLVYYPMPGPADPVKAGAPHFSRHVLHTDGNHDIIYWENTAAKNAPTVLYFHGNGGGLYWHVRSLNNLDRRGIHVVAMEYPGFPRGAAGTPSEPGIERDAATLYDALHQTDPQVVLWGYSLGTGVATHLAAERNVAGMILEAPFTAASDVAAARYPYLPAHLLMRNQYLSRKAIVKNHAPVLILHGTADTLIPIEQGRALFKLANEPKIMKEYEGFQHYNLVDSTADDDAVDFIKKLPAH